MKMKNKLVFFIIPLLFCSSAMANVSKWSTAEEKGVRVYSVDSKNKYTLRFSCDVGASNTSSDSVGTRMLELSQDFPGGKSYSDTNGILLKVGEDEYPMGQIGSTVGDSWWYGFWSDVPDSQSKAVDAYVDGKKIASFTMRKAAELYNSAPEDGCLKRAK